MSAIGLLFSNTLRKDRVRLGCALFGIAAASALLMWTLGLAATTWWQGRPLSETMGKPFDCWVATGRASGAAPKGTGMQHLTAGSPVKMIPQVVTDAVRASDDVAEVLATTVFRCRLDWRPEGRPLQGPGVGGGVSPVRDFPVCPYPDGLAAGRWPEADAAEPEFVISPLAFGPEGLKDAPPLGTRVPVVTPGGSVEATICGYLAETIRPVSGFPTLFASSNLADAARLAETEGLSNLILIKLKPFRAPDALEQQVRTLSPDDDSARLVTRAALLQQLRSDAVNSLSRQVPLLVILACMATGCMIVNALTIGIEQNRVRYARLRALGMTARQLTGLICREGLFLTIAGGHLGAFIGWGILAGFVGNRPLVFPDGLHLGSFVPAALAGLLLLSGAIALILPVRRVAQLKPCESRLQVERLPRALLLRRGVTGLLLLGPVLATPLLFGSQPLLRSAWFLLAGLPLALWGILRLVAPLLAVTEQLCVRPVGLLTGLRPNLLRGTLTAFSRRNGRMVLTLATGLGAFFAIHVWGSSLTDPFIPSRNLPDAIVSALPNGFSAAGAQTLTTLSDEVNLTPFFAEQYRLHDDDFAAITARTGREPKQNNILLLGTEGDEGVTVTAMFARQCGLGVGDTIRVQRKDRRGKVYTLPLTITRVASINWHLFSARARLRARNGAPMGTLGPVFVSKSVTDAWDPGLSDRTRFFWADLPKPLPATDAALYSYTDRLELRLQEAANRDAQANPYRVSRFGKTLPKGSPAAAPANVVVHLRDEIASGTIARSAELLDDLARIPLWSLLILCTGFISLLSANVRAMAGELKTLHAVGMTRFQMARYLFAQGLMLCAAAVLLAILSSVAIGWGFTGWTLAWMPFGGLPSVLVIPWAQIGEGLAVLFFSAVGITPLPICLLVRNLLKR